MRKHLFGLLFVVSAGWVGCSSERDSFTTQPTVFGSEDGGASSEDAGVPECLGHICSRDLRSVQDCDGNLVKECPADTACGKGECIAPCAAAAANEGSLGCSFAVTPGVDGDAQRGGCAAVFVANDWTSPATLHISFEGQDMPLDGALWVPVVEDPGTGKVTHKKLEGPIPPGSGAVVFVSNEVVEGSTAIRCPSGVTPILSKTLTVPATTIVKAMFATTDVPVSMYSIFPYGGASSFTPSATLLLPTTSFGKNYVLMSSWGGKDDIFGRGIYTTNLGPQPGKPSVQVVAVEDDTRVKLLPKVEIVGGDGVAGAAANQVVTYPLKRGEVLQIIQGKELVGSVLESDKPVGVFGGHTGIQLPVGVSYVDSENKQIPPLSVWGSEYVVMPSPDRARLAGSDADRSQDLSVIRMVGAADGTQLVYDPVQPVGAPGTLSSGELVRFFSNTPFVVRSQDRDHPFFVVTAMTGTATLTTNQSLGDPETVMNVPTQQWLDSYRFFSDYTYQRSLAVVTRRKTNGVFQDVTLDCAGALTGWERINDDFEWTYVQLSRQWEPMSYPGGTCTDGPHHMKSDGPFTMTVWGVGNCASYAYPGGMGLRTSTSFELPVH
jgi:IgGFc binding protein